MLTNKEFRLEFFADYSKAKKKKEDTNLSEYRVYFGGKGFYQQYLSDSTIIEAGIGCGYAFQKFNYTNSMGYIKGHALKPFVLGSLETEYKFDNNMAIGIDYAGKYAPIKYTTFGESPQTNFNHSINLSLKYSL